jgi:hypothetical protein
LFDQVKKMGILTANMQKQISQKKPSGGGTILNILAFIFLERSVGDP